MVYRRQFVEEPKQPWFFSQLEKGFPGVFCQDRLPEYE